MNPRLVRPEDARTGETSQLTRIAPSATQIWPTILPTEWLLLFACFGCFGSLFGGAKAEAKLKHAFKSVLGRRKHFE